MKKQDMELKLTNELRVLGNKFLEEVQLEVYKENSLKQLELSDGLIDRCSILKGLMMDFIIETQDMYLCEADDWENTMVDIKRYLDMVKDELYPVWERCQGFMDGQVFYDEIVGFDCSEEDSISIDLLDGQRIVVMLEQLKTPGVLNIDIKGGTLTLDEEDKNDLVETFNENWAPVE